MSVYEAFAAVMADVKAIEKGQRNQQQGYTFRGIDNVMQVVGPALRQHGVFIIPTAQQISSETYQTKTGTTMQNVTVTMRYTVYGPDGDSFEGVSYGQSADAGDKAVTKAQSVAYRTFLLQALTVPTGEPDPDGFSHERAAPQHDSKSPTQLARERLWSKCAVLKQSAKDAEARFGREHGYPIKDADPATIEAFAQLLEGEERMDAEREAQDAQAEAAES